MNSFIKFAETISLSLDRFASTIGRTTAWLTLVMVVITTAYVLAREFFKVGSQGVQESIIYMHAMVIMLASAYTLHEKGHVRVDIFYRHYSPLKRAWVDILGTILFLMPFAAVTIVSSWWFVELAWEQREASQDAGGIPAVYLLKSLLIAHGVLMALQGVAEIARNLITISVKEAK